jgi:anti-sigma B factor antagonist
VTTEPPEPFHADVAVDGARIVVSLRGELDSYASGRFTDSIPIDPAQVAGRHVVIDLTDLAFVDSSGLGALVVLCRGVREAGGVFSMRNPTPKIVKLLEITGLGVHFGLE